MLCSGMAITITGSAGNQALPDQNSSLSCACWRSQVTDVYATSRLINVSMHNLSDKAVPATVQPRLLPLQFDRGRCLASVHVGHSLARPAWPGSVSI